MSLWCSVLGHDYGQSVVENEHERRGDEMVFSVLEYEECNRCGDRNVISKNRRTTRVEADPEPADSEVESEPESTESASGGAQESGVTVVDDAPSTGEAPPQSSASSRPPQADVPRANEADDDGPPEASRESPETDSAGVESPRNPDEGVEVLDGNAAVSDPANDPPSASPSEPVDDEATSSDHPDAGAEVLGSETADSDPPEQPLDYPVEDTPEAQTDDPVTSVDEATAEEESEPAVTDDAEILEDDSTDPHDGWPDPDLAEDRAPDSGETQVPADEDAEILEDDSGRAPGEWPDPDHIDEDERDQYTRELTPGSDGIIEAAEETQSEAESPAEPELSEPEASSEGPMGIERPAADDAIGEDDPSELFCPQCSFVEASGQSSLRSGDICPECHRGYLGERRR